MPKLFSYLQQETELKSEEISARLYRLEPHLVGAKGKTMLELM